VAAFGPDRLLFGSDWPVCTLAAPYGRVTAATRELVAGLSTTERAAVMGGTAVTVYGLAGRRADGMPRRPDAPGGVIP
jgi:L-fuconolactonase